MDLVSNFAKQKNATPAQRCSLVVPGIGTIHDLCARIHASAINLGAVSVELTQDDLRKLDEATSALTVQGARYSEGGQRMIDR